MRIAITGGKGGTGKSTIATSLASYISKDRRVLLFDADVDCPNDHIILSSKRKNIGTVTHMVPKWDMSKCTRCGRCSEVCKMNAVVQVRERNPIFIADQCNGCGACMIACPSGAISKSKKDIGHIYTSNNGNVDMIGGDMIPGQMLSEFVVSAAKKEVEEKSSDYDVVITDTAAGTHCDVISALIGNEMAIAVTEPTQLGAHDLKLVMKLLKVLGIPAKIVLNRSDIGDPGLIEDVAKRYGSEIIASIPYSKSVIDSYSKGKPVRDSGIENMASYISGLDGNG
ncbi:MAG: P-loop ATPase [Candidatus Aenigmatarchaeota archaeon]|nr:MAG: P-loop ATPase [Candidatus Aenigmarchaeota archaeon]